jgi:hypothetical protein
MKFKHCLIEDPDGKIHHYERYTNQTVAENKHLLPYLYGGLFLNMDLARDHEKCYPKFLNSIYKNVSFNLIRIENDTILIKGPNRPGRLGEHIQCESWIFFKSDQTIEPTDFNDW